MAANTLLPEEFADLEPFARVWALPSANERYERRLASSMEELQEFYDAMVPRAEAALAYLDQFALDDIPDPALHLFWMLAALSAVGLAVDVFKQPRVPDTNGATMPWAYAPTP